jgi:hypothetical protein
MLSEKQTPNIDVIRLTGALGLVVGVFESDDWVAPALWSAHKRRP